jgi:restriction endonuclease S subunit
MMTPLGHIADVRMGVTLRGRDATRPDLNGSCRMIRISDLSDDGRLANDELVQFEPGETIKPDFFLRAGDVLFPNRGTRTTGYAFDLPDSNVIVGSQFYIIRPDFSIALPEYMAWFLRTGAASQHFHLRRKGTLVQTLQRRDIEELLLPLPPLAKQRSIVALDELAVQEHQISTQLANLRSIHLQQTLLQFSRKH